MCQKYIAAQLPYQNVSALSTFYLDWSLYYFIQLR